MGVAAGHRTGVHGHPRVRCWGHTRRVACAGMEAIHRVGILAVHSNPVMGSGLPQRGVIALPEPSPRVSRRVKVT